MENYNIKDKNHSNSIWSGLIILTVGVVFFLRSYGIYIPHWVLSWHTLLIVIGLVVGFKRNFQGGGWLIIVLIGGYFTIEDIADVDFSKYYFAIIFIVLGLYLILRPKRNLEERWRRKEERWRRRGDRWKSRFGETPYVYPQPEVTTETGAADAATATDSSRGGADTKDILNSVNIFGGANHMVYSKNFKGGEAVAVFGGCEINLSQADFEGTVTIDIVAIFGGVKIIVPPSWEVRSEVTAIFGGVDDKRAVPPFNGEGARKILIIEGVALCGGVDIRNF